MQQIFFSRWQKIKRNCLTTYLIWKPPGRVRTIPLHPDPQRRAGITEILCKRLNVENGLHRLKIKSIADEIWASFQEPLEAALEHRMMATVDGVSSQAFWFHGQLAALTAMWEFRVRLFAQKLGIKSYVEKEDKSKQNKAKKSIQQRTLSELIAEINRATGQRLTLKLNDLCGLRDAIIHCNPQGIRAYSQPIFGKETLKRVRGNVVVMTLNDNALTNLSEAIDGADAEAHDMFTWFLETFNSGLPKKAFAAFEASLGALNDLTEFAALSFEGREEVFRKFLKEGIKLSREEVESYRQSFQTMPHNSGKSMDDFFKRLTSYVKAT